MNLLLDWRQFWASKFQIKGLERWDFFRFYKYTCKKLAFSLRKYFPAWGWELKKWIFMICILLAFPFMSKIWQLILLCGRCGRWRGAFPWLDCLNFAKYVEGCKLKQLQFLEVSVACINLPSQLHFLCLRINMMKFFPQFNALANLFSDLYYGRPLHLQV